VTPAELLAATDALLTAGEERVLVEGGPRGTHAERVLARFDAVDEELVAKGFPATSPWWRGQIGRWYTSGCRQFVPRCGRRGGKSSSLSRLAVVHALEYDQSLIPPGDVGTVAIVSTDRGEALGRLRTIEAILDALGVAWKPCKAPIVGIELVDRRIVFRVFTASIAGVSGFTAIFILCDEVAKWRDSDTGVNPASEVLASVRPTMATQRDARIVLSSSPMGRLDAHYDAYEEGDTDFQIVAHAETWIANPTVTEEETHKLEPDESTWMREYAAIPQAEAEMSLLTEFLVDRMTRPLDLGDLPREPGHYYVATMDPATRGNAWTLTVGTLGVDGKKRVVMRREKRGTKAEPLSPKAVFAEWAPDIKKYGINVIHTDQWSVDSLRDNARDAGLMLTEVPWTAGTKAEAYEAMLKEAQADELEVPLDANIRQDLLGVRKLLTRNGVIYVLVTVKGRHSDYAPTLAMLFMHTRIRAKAQPKPTTTDEQHAKDKAAFLAGLSRERERAQKQGRMPPTHRRLPR
jgi:hypothetical protein